MYLNTSYEMVNKKRFLLQKGLKLFDEFLTGVLSASVFIYQEEDKDMKKIIVVLLMTLMVFGLVGCSSNKPAETETETPESTVLNVMNWGEYIGEDVISNFEEKFGVKVNYTLYDSNEMLYTKVSTDKSYDVVVPADYMLERMIREDMLQPLDFSIITNTDYLNDDAMNILYQLDKEGKYSMPYFVATAGIIYDRTVVDPADVEAEGWAVMKNPKYAGQVFVYDSERDSFMMALKNLGYSANTEDPDEIQAAYDWLVELNDTMAPAYGTDEVFDTMIYGNKALGFAYSGDAAYMMSENENLAYYIPNEGSRLAIDGMVILKDSKNSKLANEFINFMLSYESSLDNSLTVGYTSCDNRVREELTAEGGDYEGSEAYLFDLKNPNSEVFFDNEVLRETLSELWVKIKVK